MMAMNFNDDQSTNCGCHSVACNEPKYDELQNAEQAIELLIDRRSRTALFLIPFNGSEFLKRTLRKSGFNCIQSSDPKKTLDETCTQPEHWLFLTVLRDPIERIVDCWLRVIANRQGESQSADQSLNANTSNANKISTEISAADVQAVFKLTVPQADTIQSIENAIAGLDVKDNGLHIVDFWHIPQFLIALESRIGRSISPKKVPRLLKRLNLKLDVPAKKTDTKNSALSNWNEFPYQQKTLPNELVRQIRSRFAIDYEFISNRDPTLISKPLSNHQLQTDDIEICDLSMSDIRQITSKTSFDRYPKIFRFVSDQIDASKQLSILSVGCSSGEECQSLRTYFPKATIIGLDIRPININKAIHRNADPKIAFRLATDEFWNESQRFDLIFAMSVFCRWPDTYRMRDCSSLYRFDMFESDMQRIDASLNSCGLFVLYNCNFRFTDTQFAERYEPMIVPDQQESGFVAKFSRQNKRLNEEYTYTIFRKKLLP